MLALKIAVGKFPLAIATITTDDETVEGKTPRKNMAIQISDLIPSSKTGMNINVSSGNNKKVTDWISKCER